MSDDQEQDNGRLTQKERAVLYAAYRILDARYHQRVPMGKIRQKMVGKAFKIVGCVEVIARTSIWA